MVGSGTGKQEIEKMCRKSYTNGRVVVGSGRWWAVVFVKIQDSRFKIYFSQKDNYIQYLQNKLHDFTTKT